MSIRSKLITSSLAAIIIPTVVVLSIVYSNARGSLEEQSLERLANVADLKKEKIEVFFSERGKSLEETGNYPELKEGLPVLVELSGRTADPRYVRAKKAVDQRLRKLEEIYGYVDIFMTDPAGKVVYAFKDQSHLGKPLRDPSGKSLDEGKKGVCFCDMYFNKADGGKYCMLGVAPVRDMRESLAGVIAFEIDMKPIYAFIQSTAGLGNTGETLIGAKAGERIMFLNPLRHDPDAALKRTAAFGGQTASPMQHALLMEAGVGFETDYRGKEVIAAWRYIPMLKWGLVAKKDVSEAFAPAAKLGNLALLLVMMALAFGSIASMMIAKQITAPIEALATGSVIIGSGNLDYKVGTGGKDEIGKLSRAFDNMAANLKKVTASRDELDREVAERKKAEEEKAALFNMLTHDIKGPLTVICGYGELLLEKTTDKEIGRMLTSMCEASGRVSLLVSDMLTLSRMETGRAALMTEEVTLPEVLRQAVRDHEMPAREMGVTLSLEVDEDLPSIEADRAQLTRAVGNLISNAVKYNRRGGAVTVRAGRMPDDAERIFIEVTDTGTGIPAADLPLVFNRYYRCRKDSQKPGTGLGLAIVKAVAEAHCGSVQVDSRDGEGSTFTVVVPRACNTPQDN